MSPGAVHVGRKTVVSTSWQLGSLILQRKEATSKEQISDIDISSKIFLFNFDAGKHAESLKTAEAVDLITRQFFPQIWFRTGQTHFLHVLMLRSNCKPIHMHRNRYDNFVGVAGGAIRTGISADSMR